MCLSEAGSAVLCKDALMTHLNATDVQRKVQCLTPHPIYNLEGKMHFVIIFFGMFKSNRNVKWALR